MAVKKRKTPAPRDRGGVIYAIGIGADLVADARAKAAAERWPLSEVIRRLLTLWVKGKVKID